MKRLIFVSVTLLTLSSETKYKRIFTKKAQQQLLQKKQTEEKAKQTKKVLSVFENGIEIISMGSDSVLPCIKKYLPTNPVVVEAGAYDGKDTERMAELWPQGKIYAFEPVPENFNNLEKNTDLKSNVKRFPLALSDKNGTAEFFNSACVNTPNTPSQSGSLLSPKEHLTYDHGVIFNNVTTVPTVTLDSWAQENGIDHVDLLWLDMQGYELNMLMNSPNILKTVKVVYTEVEFVEAYQGQYQYQHVRGFLESLGFTLVAKDFEEPPTYWFGNAVFVRN